MENIKKIFSVLFIFLGAYMSHNTLMAQDKSPDDYPFDVSGMFNEWGGIINPRA